MKSSKEVRLSLEVLEDRIALNGAFGGAIGAGAPNVPPVNGLSTNTSNVGNPQPGFRDSFANYNSDPTLAGQMQIVQDQFQSYQSQLQSFQSQLQSFQAAQTQALDQYFSELGTMLQPLHINTFLIL